VNETTEDSAFEVVGATGQIRSRRRCPRPTNPARRSARPGRRCRPQASRRPGELVRSRSGSLVEGLAHGRLSRGTQPAPHRSDERADVIHRQIVKAFAKVMPTALLEEKASAKLV